MTPHESFRAALAATLEHEGVDSDHPLDPGGQTYMGISRVYWPDWPGWEIIDNDGFDDEVTRRLLDRLVHEFYRTEFWGRVKGDQVSTLSPAVAAELFDTAVNRSVHAAVIILQQALNLLNRNELIYPDLVEDGRIGPRTLNTLRQYLQGSPESRLLRVMNTLQGMHYVEQMRRWPQKEEFRGWFDRV